MRELPWWSRPSGLNVWFLLPVLLVVIWAGGSDLRSRDYLSAPYIALYVWLVLVSAAGAWLGENVRQHAVFHSPVEHLARVAIWVGVLVLATYLFWYRSLIFNPALLINVLTGAEKPERTDIGTLTGITSLVNLAPLFFSLAGYVLFVRGTRNRALVALTSILLLFTFFRVYIWSERIAGAEALIPLALALLGNDRPKPHQRARKLFWRFGPYAALPAVFLFFAVAEFFRSWSYYADRMAFWEFAFGRFVSYYYTSLNNGAGMMATATNWPTGTFELVLTWLHTFPLGIGPWFSDLVGLQAGVGEVFLQRYGDPEFNTIASFASVTLDLGVAGATLYFFIAMLCAGILYSRYTRGDPLSVMLFPSALVAIFDAMRIPYWGTSRAFVWLLGTLVILAVLWIFGSIGTARPSTNAQRSTS